MLTYRSNKNLNITPVSENKQVKIMFKINTLV